MTWLLYPMLCTAAYYLAARARITEDLWKRYPAWLNELTLCSACSGFWYGLGCGGLGWWRGWSFAGLPGDHWLTVVLVGLCGVVWTPLLAALHLHALRHIDPETDPATPIWGPNDVVDMPPPLPPPSDRG